MPPEEAENPKERDKELVHVPGDARKRVRTVSFGCENGETHIVCYRKFVGDAMDRHLETIGYVKRCMPDDGLSLYRAISEEIFLSQRRENVEMVKSLISLEVEMQYKIKRIHEGKNGHKVEDKIRDELRAAAKIFNAVIRVFDKVNTIPTVYEPSDDKKAATEILLCETTPTVFSRVVEKYKAEACGEAQALLYQSLYKDVYGMPKERINECIQRVRVDMDIASWDPSRWYTPSAKSPATTFPIVDIHPFHTKFRPPIPFCAIKAMDPSIYRNISYDSYQKEKREKNDIKHEQKLRTVDEFPIGSVCLAKFRGVVQKAYVVAEYDNQHRVLKFENGGNMELVSIYDMRNGVAKVPKRPHNLDLTNCVIMPPPMAPPQPLMQMTAPMTPISAQPMHSPINYILEPLSWPGAVPPSAPPVTPTGIFPQNHTGRALPPENNQRRTSVAEQIMYNYSKFPIAPTTIPYIEQKNVVPASYGEELQHKMDNLSINPHVEPLSTPPASARSDQSYESVFLPSTQIPASPYFNADELKYVTFSNKYSLNTDGSDLPDILSVRYYFNLGVKYARRLVGQSAEPTESYSHSSSETFASYGQPPPHMVPNPPPSFITPASPMNGYCASPPMMPPPPPPNMVFTFPQSPMGVTLVNGTTYFPPQQQQQTPSSDESQQEQDRD